MSSSKVQPVPVEEDVARGRVRLPGHAALQVLQDANLIERRPKGPSTQVRIYHPVVGAAIYQQRLNGARGQLRMRTGQWDRWQLVADVPARATHRSPGSCTSPAAR